MDPKQLPPDENEPQRTDQHLEDADDPFDNDFELPPPPRPTETNIEVDDFDDGLTIRVPARGIWKGSGGLMVGAIIWCGIMTLFSSIMICGILGDDQAGGKFEGLPIFAGIIGLFWLVGLGMLLGAIDM